MIFLGDIAFPLNIIPNFTYLPDGFKNNVIANLEGPILPDNIFPVRSQKLFNCSQVFTLLKLFNVKAVSLANNHILDFPDFFHETLLKLDKNNIKYTGAGDNIEDATKPVIFFESNQQYALLSFGWDVINCKYATKQKLGVSPLEIDNLTKSINKTSRDFPDSKIIILVHWNYELELYPQPMHRELAKKAIDLGIEAVIGHHSHCVQGIEIYKNKPIIYGLGNWFIPDGVFFDGRLSYPELSKKQFAIEIHHGNTVLHQFEYNSKNNTIVYHDSSHVKNSKILKELTPFQGMTHEEYIAWFHINRRKKLMLPVFKDYNHRIENSIFKKFIKLRQLAINILLKVGLKNRPK